MVLTSCLFGIFNIYCVHSNCVNLSGRSICSADSIPMKSISTKDWKTELTEIDAELERMDEEQKRLKRSHARWEDDGSRWQFQQGMTQEAKRAFEKADADKLQMEKNQKYIDALNARRAKILKEHPEANDL